LNSGIVFLSEGRINIFNNNTLNVLNCEVADKYKQREREIRARNEWKNSGAGAMFTGSFHFEDDSKDFKLSIVGLSQSIDERLVFSINYENGGGIYFKHLDTSQPETPIFVNNKTRFFELSVSKSGYIAVSSATDMFERHITLLRIDDTYPQDVTEGDCSDCNPKWSLKDENVLYYDSAGIAYSSNGHFAGYGPRSIYRLNVETGELAEVLEGDKFEYIQPFEDDEGNLYYIKRPYKVGSGKMSAKDMVKAPGKVFRAFGGWLDFVSRRYTGESLKTGGANPAKGNPKSQGQLFVDGNLLEADKALKRNAAAGDKNPGFVPRDWQLIRRNAAGNEEVLQAGVMSYSITKGGIIYSNGKFVISGESATKVHLAAKLIGGAAK